MNGRRVPAHPYLLLALATLFWSGNFVLGRAVHARIPPIGMGFWRWAIALCVLLPFAWPHLKLQWPVILRSWRTVVPLGILGIGSFNTLVYIGLHDTTATNAILLNSACPAFIVAISYIIRSQVATSRQCLGIAVSLAGVGSIVCRGCVGNLLSLSFNRGDLWILSAVLCWAAYTHLLKRRPEGVHPLALLPVLMGIGVACLAPLHVWEISRGMRVTPGAATIGTLLYLALLAVLLLGESFRPFHAAGIALILAGVALAGGSPPARRPAESSPTGR